MKRISTFILLTLFLPFCVLSQSDTWPVVATNKGGKSFPVNVYLEDGTAVPVFAIYEEGNDHFMDVKGVHNGKKISIKLISSNDMLVPVKGISVDGKILNVKAVDANDNILDVKGVSRDGNTMNLAAISNDGKDLPLHAISPSGVERPVKGVKFVDDNVEMEFGDIQVIGHVKALPTIDVGDIDRKWEVAATSNDGTKMYLFAISKKGKKYPVKAYMAGVHPYLMNVKADARLNIHIKLVKDDNGIVASGIDEFGRIYDVKAITESEDAFDVVGGTTMSNVTPIYVKGVDGEKIPLKAISSDGHEFDVKGLKVKEGDEEGVISGLNVWIRYYAHIKALAPAQKD